GAERLPAPRRPRPEPRRDRERLRDPGAHGAGGGHQGARERDIHPADAAGAQRSEGARALPGGSESAVWRAESAPRDRRALPGPQVESELPRAPVTARG